MGFIWQEKTSFNIICEHLWDLIPLVISPRNELLSGITGLRPIADGAWAFCPISNRWIFFFFFGMDQQTPFHLPVGPCVHLVETGNLMTWWGSTDRDAENNNCSSFLCEPVVWPDCLFSGIRLRALTSVSMAVSHVLFVYYFQFLELFAKKMKEFTGFNVDVMWATSCVWFNEVCNKVFQSCQMANSCSVWLMGF